MTDNQPGAPDEEELEELEEEIQEVRHHVAEDAGEAERHFIDEGTADDDGAVDDTIAPG